MEIVFYVVGGVAWGLAIVSLIANVIGVLTDTTKEKPNAP